MGANTGMQVFFKFKKQKTVGIIEMSARYFVFMHMVAKTLNDLGTESQICMQCGAHGAS